MKIVMMTWWEKEKAREEVKESVTVNVYTWIMHLFCWNIIKHENNANTVGRDHDDDDDDDDDRMNRRDRREERGGMRRGMRYGDDDDDGYWADK